MKKSILNYLGQIVTIVIGIWGGFTLNNWGAERDQRQTEFEILRQIHQELTDNLEDLQQDFALLRLGMESHARVVDFLDRRIPWQDTLIFDFHWLAQDEYAFANTSGYENLKALGLEIIRNDSLRSLIPDLYNHNFPRLTKGQTLHPDITAYLADYYHDHFLANRDTTLFYNFELVTGEVVTFPRQATRASTTLKRFIGYHPRDVEALRSDERFQLLLAEVLEFRMYKCAYYQRCIRRVELIKGLIERQYLDRI